MQFWRRKDGPILRRSRAVHLVVGLGVPLCANVWVRHLAQYQGWPAMKPEDAGYNAQGWASGACLALAFLWEVLTPVLGRRWGWAHAWGDVVDLGAVLLGIAIAALAA